MGGDEVLVGMSLTWRVRFSRHWLFSRTVLVRSATDSPGGPTAPAGPWRPATPGRTRGPTQLIAKKRHSSSTADEPEQDTEGSQPDQPRNPVHVPHLTECPQAGALPDADVAAETLLT